MQYYDDVTAIQQQYFNKVLAHLQACKRDDEEFVDQFEFTYAKVTATKYHLSALSDGTIGTITRVKENAHSHGFLFEGGGVRDALYQELRVIYEAQCKPTDPELINKVQKHLQGLKKEDIYKPLLRFKDTSRSNLPRILDARNQITHRLLIPSLIKLCIGNRGKILALTGPYWHLNSDEIPALEFCKGCFRELSYVRDEVYNAVFKDLPND